MYSTNQHTSSKDNKVQVAMNSCYDLLYDEAKNRIYFTIHGFWKNKECVPDFISDWQKILSLVRPGFTVLSDMQSMITHPQELTDLHEQAQTMIIDADVKKVAHVMPTDKIAYLQVLSIHSQTRLPIKPFSKLEDAVNWLDVIGVASDN